MKLLTPTGEVIPIEKITVLDLKAGDTIVLTFRYPLSREAHNNIKYSFSNLFPLNNVIILENGLEISKINKL